MKIIAFVSIICTGYAIVSQSAIGMEVVANCALGSDRNHTVALLRDHFIDSTAIYYVSMDGAAPAHLYQGTEDLSRGENMRIACVGVDEHALVISGEFSSNYVQGVVVRYNAKAGRWERVDFAERARPTALYLDPKGVVVLIPNSTKNESDKRYIFYRYETGKDGGEQTYSNQLPESRSVKIPSAGSGSRIKKR